MTLKAMAVFFNGNFSYEIASPKIFQILTARLSYGNGRGTFSSLGWWLNFYSGALGNVVAKTFLSEQDAPETIEFFRACVAQKLHVVAPDIVKYEVAQTAMKHSYPVGRVMNIFRDQLSTLIDMRSPEGEVWEQAEAICQHGHPKSGYPTVYDSIYHAMAIIEDGLFITADRRHYEKAKTFGHIALLSNWKSALDTLGLE